MKLTIEKRIIISILSALWAVVIVLFILGAVGDDGHGSHTFFWGGATVFGVLAVMTTAGTVMFYLLPRIADWLKDHRHDIW